jgi:hypothetical protein
MEKRYAGLRLMELLKRLELARLLNAANQG